MAMGTVPGPVGQVWRIVMLTMEYFSSNYDVNNQNKSMIQALCDTFKNALDWVNGYSYLQALQSEAALLQQFQALPVVQNSDVVYLNNRATALVSCASALSNILPLIPPTPNLGVLAQGQPLISTVDLVSFWMEFSYETPTLSLTPSSFSTEFQNVATAFANALALLELQGSTQNSQIEPCLQNLSQAAQVSSA